MAITVKKGTAEPKKLPVTKAKTGPSAMPADKFFALLEWVKRGESVSAAAKRPGMPAESTFHAWRKKSEANDQLYRDALAFQVDGLVDGVLPMLDSLFNGQKTVTEAGKLRRAAMRIQHVQWVASRRDPAHYGAQVAGDDGTFKLINSPDDGEGKPDATKKVS